MANDETKRTETEQEFISEAQRALRRIIENNGIGAVGLQIQPPEHDRETTNDVRMYRAVAWLKDMLDSVEKLYQKMQEQGVSATSTEAYNMSQTEYPIATMTRDEAAQAFYDLQVLFDQVEIFKQGLLLKILPPQLHPLLMRNMMGIAEAAGIPREKVQEMRESAALRHQEDQERAYRTHLKEAHGFTDEQIDERIAEMKKHLH